MAVDIVVNIQGDEPLIQHSVIDQLVETLRDDAVAAVATPIRILKDKDKINDPNVVKVVVDKDNYALYFSRSVIPCNRDQKSFTDGCYYQHLGLYAYRKEFLLEFVKLPKSFLEKAELLEQLRVLEAGYKIKTVLTDVQAISVDTEDDLLAVKKMVEKNEKHG